MTARVRTLVVATITVALTLSGLAASAQAPAPAKPATPTAATPPSAAPKPMLIPPRHFASAEDAVQALVSAVRAGDVNAMVRVLGSDARALVVSGDPVLDRRARERFVGEYDAGHSLVASGETTVLTSVATTGRSPFRW